MAKTVAPEAETIIDADLEADLAAATADVDEDLLVKATNMNIKKFVPAPKAGRYDDEVQTLIRIDAETGYTNSIEILVPAAEVKKYKRYFTTSAHNFGKGARIVNGDLGVTQGDGGVLLEFVLTDRVVRKAKPVPTA